jgi:hypothetical protein
MASPCSGICLAHGGRVNHDHILALMVDSVNQIGMNRYMFLCVRRKVDEMNFNADRRADHRYEQPLFAIAGNSTSIPNGC